MPSDQAMTEELYTAPKQRYKRRLSDKILIAFHQACDQDDVEVAWALLNLLEFMTTRMVKLPTGEDRRSKDKDSLVAAHERLWHMRHPRFEFSCPSGDPGSRISSRPLKPQGGNAVTHGEN
jgi:hypothetical protein